jgi:hypothetical protein
MLQVKTFMENLSVYSRMLMEYRVRDHQVNLFPCALSINLAPCQVPSDLSDASVTASDVLEPHRCNDSRTT